MSVEEEETSFQKVKELELTLRLDNWKCSSSFVESVQAFIPICIGRFLHNTIQLAVEHSVTQLHSSHRAGDGLISLEKAYRSLFQSKVDTGRESRPCRCISTKIQTHNSLPPFFPTSSRLPPTSRARLQRGPGCTIVLTRCFVTHGAEFRVEPVLKFCSMSEVHAGLICSTVECTTRMCRKARRRSEAGRTERMGYGSEIYWNACCIPGASLGTGYCTV